MKETEKFFIDKVNSGVLEVSLYGEVFNTITKRFIGAINSRGYKQICMKGKTRKHIKSITIHRLVYLYYIGNIPDNYTINHKDLNKNNNFYKNLEAVSVQDNIKHARTNGIIGYRFQKGNIFHFNRKTVGRKPRTN